MNLTNLFETQKLLDEEIEKKHPVQPGENRLRKKILATLTEVAECANEFPEVFKFWSNKKNNTQKGLVELVDILHFLLSIGNEHRKVIVPAQDIKKSSDTEDCMIDLCFQISCIEFVEEAYSLAFYRYSELTQRLGFSWEEIEQSYMEKNKINYQRQEAGY
ncbi:dimeric dUTPase (all-alpha-NTP-PPase superfamily) [Planomicrobium stackebrandtii]|uniref:Dimeric dUTPase (All-alpha-NTP-PPase superfamily) n=1 Tax=Planomicrobium stackebrandtii TaxID=253160 RepID=A0ABU0GQR3_9BACL|nr:dUTP diphosphatase [Planomicrobium stackebrandtii]MDQ0427699.1 dimeric dUTPase (all-alpha-NTP-PPase superfamily) [Planomicrobium stackebrandtii]